MDSLEVKNNIEELKIELGNLLDKSADFDEIYKTSVKLDQLIVAYYRLKSEELN